MFQARSLGRAPVADAGPDQVVDRSAGAVQLDGTASGGCGSWTWLWAIQSKPVGSALGSGDVVGLNDEDASFTPDELGSYTFSFAVRDDELWSSPDVVVIAVR